MAQYQSFPDAAGDSRTLDKLRALRLPALEGRSFLDVGCNEGFFCGFARFAGARRAVGLDRSKLFLDRARARFPECEFVLGDWGRLPEGPFDVVLLASALHYADDQEALLRRLVDMLSPDGVLVLELGVVNSSRSEWRKVQRGDDVRRFPSMKKLEEILAPYAWKWLGPSVDQAGDPVKRHVVHVSRRRPLAYLLLQPPGYGKTTIARHLFARAGIQVVSGDEIILQVARRQREAPEALQRLLAEEFSPFHIDQAIHRAFERRQGAALVRVFADAVQGGDFALDVYVPADCHEMVEDTLRGIGYLPVRLDWERVGGALLPDDHQDRLTTGWIRQLSTRPLRTGAPAAGRGYVDTAVLDGQKLLLAGWAVDNGRRYAAGALEIQLDGEAHSVPVSVWPRRDVQRRLGLEHERFGFRTEWTLPPELSLAGFLRHARICAVFENGRIAPLRWSEALLKQRVDL